MGWEKKVPKEETGPEAEIRKILEGLHRRKGISFQTQKPHTGKFFQNLKWIDLLVDGKLAIEVHGDHKAKWHKTTQERKDEVKRNALLAEGFKVMDIIADKRQIKKWCFFIEDRILEFLKCPERYCRIDSDLPYYYFSNEPKDEL